MAKNKITAISITSTIPEVNRLLEKFSLSKNPYMLIKKALVNKKHTITNIKILTASFLEMPKNNEIMIPAIKKIKVP